MTVNCCTLNPPPYAQHLGNRAESGKSKGFSCTWDSLRNSAGEKILQLRSHPLGMPSDSNFCSLLSDLSLEQRFDVSYLDLGELTICCSLSLLQSTPFLPD